MLVGFSINHLFWGTSTSGNLHMSGYIITTSLQPHHRWWLVRWIIPKWPYFRLVNYANLPRMSQIYTKFGVDVCWAGPVRTSLASGDLLQRLAVSLLEILGFFMGDHGYLLVIWYIAIETHNFPWENPLCQWPFSMAMFVYQRVNHSHLWPNYSG